MPIQELLKHYQGVIERATECIEQYEAMINFSGSKHHLTSEAITGVAGTRQTILDIDYDPSRGDQAYFVFGDDRRLDALDGMWPLRCDSKVVAKQIGTEPGLPAFKGSATRASALGLAREEFESRDDQVLSEVQAVVLEWGEVNEDPVTLVVHNHLNGLDCNYTPAMVDELEQCHRAGELRGISPELLAAIHGLYEPKLDHITFRLEGHKLMRSMAEEKRNLLQDLVEYADNKRLLSVTLKHAEEEAIFPPDELAMLKQQCAVGLKQARPSSGLGLQ
ncbi:hypothetical protein [Ferrimonas marina]|uniref:Uncharacterized protein n=1 Tax=Ferrimonas marina TaxID=299255 RepID=A0A1M5T7C9_9GAMM|nr:hypothetical protein [Ferrimonas marina]SHH46578.1 hypothetical protein SAMN02745129_2027 [Ferrimonas marina]